jgi:hypothetical protein
MASMKKKFNFLIVVITILLSSCSVFNTRTESRLVESPRNVASSSVERILEELKTYIEFDLSPERKEEIKIVQENILKYFIDTTHSDTAHKVQIYHEATNYFNKIYPILLENIRNEKKGVQFFVTIKRAPIWTLEEELKFLNKEVENLPSAAVKVDILQWIKLTSRYYQHLDADSKASIYDLYDTNVNTTNKVIKVFGKDFSIPISFSEVDKILQFNGTDEEAILKISKLIENKFQKHELSIRNVGSEIAKSGQLDMNNHQIQLVVSFMDYYFNKLPDSVIKTIMSELVSAGPKLTEETVIKIVFQNTGPGLGKLLQQMAKEEGIGAKFSEMMSILESSGKEVPYHLVQEIVDGDKGGYKISKISEHALGTGTVGQVNKAILEDDTIEKKIALRFLKPGVKKRCLEDIAILSRYVRDNTEALKEVGITDLKVIDTLINGVKNFLDEEVVIPISIARQKQAYEIYSRTIKIESDPKYQMLEMRIPNVFDSPTGDSELHIQEFLTGGEKFSDVNNVIPQKIAAEEMLRMWFEEALFKSGYLHADLHSGNFRVVLLEDEKKIKILVYDFGLTTTLTKEEQRAFLLLGAGAYLKSPSVLADGFISSMNSKDRNLRARLIKDIKAELKIEPDKTAEGWVKWSVQKSYFVSDKLGAFARGAALLKLLPQSMGDSEMFKNVIYETAMKNFKQSYADHHYNFPLSKIDLIKLGAAQIKLSCMEAVKSFFKLFGKN